MSRERLIRDLTLTLLYLTSWEEDAYDFEEMRPSKIRRAWKGADWDALDSLRDDDLLSFVNKNKSVYITAEGEREARRLLDEMGLLQWGEAQDRADEAGHADAQPVPAFTFRLSFAFEYLTCWRILRVPKALSFDELHTVIQACMWWLNYHVYDFEYRSDEGRCTVSLPDPDTGGDPTADFLFFDEEGEAEWSVSTDVHLDEVFSRVRQARYSYDYGDGWMIDLVLLDENEPLVGEAPICLDGGGDNPPEDVGGEGGFEEFLRILADPDDYQHDEMVTWGKSQHFEHYDLEKTNTRLSHWKDWIAG